MYPSSKFYTVKTTYEYDLHKHLILHDFNTHITLQLILKSFRTVETKFKNEPSRPFFFYKLD